MSDKENKMPEQATDVRGPKHDALMYELTHGKPCQGVKQNGQNCPRKAQPNDIFCKIHRKSANKKGTMYVKAQGPLYD